MASLQAAEKLPVRAVQHASWLGRTLSLRRTTIGAALLGEIERTGYIARRNTIDPDATAIAAPVYGPVGEIVAAFSITGPTYRISNEDLIRFGALVVEETRIASIELGAPARCR